MSSYLIDHGIADKSNAAMILTVYGITVAIAAWLSGSLSDLWGPRQAMAVGLVIWVIFEIGFLLFGLGPKNLPAVVAMYGLRGFGYPLFAYGFLVWISVAVPQHRLSTAVGWFWFALTGGLLTLGPLMARYAIPAIGPFNTLWLSLGFVIFGGVIALIGLQEPTGKRRLAPEGAHPLRTLAAQPGHRLGETKDGHWLHRAGHQHGSAERVSGVLSGLFHEGRLGLRRSSGWSCSALCF